MGFARSSSLAGVVFLVFPCPYPIVFSSFSLTVYAALSRFIGFPFVSLPVAACRRAVRYRSSPVPVSSSVSVFVLLGGEVLPVPWCWCLFRGVALRGLAGRPAVSLDGSFFCGAWGGAFWLVFSYGIIGRVIRGRGEAYLRRLVRETPGGFCVPSGRSSRFGLFLYVLICGVSSSYFRLRRAMVWAAMAVETSRAVAAPACSTPVWTSCGVSAGAGVSVAWMVGCGAVLMLVMTRR